MNASLTEAQSYTREARRSEEIANRLEEQASFFEGNSANGSLNLSQAYREWGLGEIERNRDYYGNARFDDIDFQLGAQGQALQARFIDGYADELRSDIQDQLVLTTGQPIARPNVTSASDVRASSSVSAGSDFRPDASNLGVAEIRNEVADAQIAGRRRIGTVNNYLDGITKEAKGASEKSADDVKEWK